MIRLADFKPMLLSERQLDLEEPGWIYELEYDGVRVTAEFGARAVQLRTRNGADATKWFPEITDSWPKCQAGRLSLMERSACSTISAAATSRHFRSAPTIGAGTRGLSRLSTVSSTSSSTEAQISRPSHCCSARPL